MGLFSLLSNRKQAQSAEPASPVKVKSHGVAGSDYHQKELQAMGKKNPDYELDKRGLLKRWPGGVTVYEYTFNPKTPQGKK